MTFHGVFKNKAFIEMLALMCKYTPVNIQIQTDLCPPFSTLTRFTPQSSPQHHMTISTSAWWMQGPLLIAMRDGWRPGDDWWAAGEGANKGGVSDDSIMRADRPSEALAPPQPRAGGEDV